MHRCLGLQGLQNQCAAAACAFDQRGGMEQGGIHGQPMWSGCPAPAVGAAGGHQWAHVTLAVVVSRHGRVRWEDQQQDHVTGVALQKFDARFGQRLLAAP